MSVPAGGPAACSGTGVRCAAVYRRRHHAPGIQINGGATLTIQGSGSLNATGRSHTGNSGAIGSSYNNVFGNIAVNGGKLTTVGSNNSRKADSIAISGGTLTGLHNPILADTVSITGGSIGTCYDGEVTGRKLTRPYFASSGSALINPPVTITEGSNRWTAETDGSGILPTYLADSTSFISATAGSTTKNVTGQNGGRVNVTCKSTDKYTFTMPAGAVTVEAVFEADSAQTAFPFTDTEEGFWAREEIRWAWEKGYMNGTSATSFTPNGTISRQQAWMILSRTAGEDPADMAAARAWAVERGMADGTLNPGGTATRA